MAFASLKGVTYFPRLPFALLTLPGISTCATLDAVGEGVGIACRAPKTGNIRKLIVRTGNVSVGSTVTATGRLKEIDRTATPAIPHATNLSHVNATGDVTNLTSSSDNVFVTFTLTADAAVVQGDELMVEVLLTAIGSTASVILNSFSDDTGKGYPYAVTNVSGAYALAGQTAPPLAFEYDDGSYEPVTGLSIGAPVTSTTFASGSTPDTWAQTFRFPFPVQLYGYWLWTDNDDDFTIRVCTTDYHQANATGILVSDTVKMQDRAAATSNIIECPFPETIDLAANTDYMLVIEPGATGITIYDQGFPSLAAMDADDGGQNFYLRTAKDPTGDGDWTKFNTGTFRQMYCGLLLKGFSDGAGGAGGGPGFGQHGIGGPTFKGAA